ncbi:MAG: thioredoxin [Nanoarchaeota archaeon]|mgnify:CR=1 FL=1
MAKNHEVPEVSEKEFESFTKKGIVLIDFFAEWCMPCVMMAPVIDELSEKFSGKIKFGKVNVDDNQKLSQKFSVFSIPSFIIFKEGKITDKLVGSVSSEELEEKLEGYLK